MSLELWDKLKSVPVDALKKIEAGRLKGRHDISPVWRYERMTEIFGPCGIGWKYEIEALHWVDAGAEKMVFVQINLYVKDENKWSAPIPGFGGDFAIQQERAGLHTNDEALKMAVTDALGYAMQKLGVAADVYRGKADDSKYGRENHQANTNTPPKQNNPAPANSGAKNPCSEAQQRRIETLWQELGRTESALKAELKKCFSVESVSLLEMPQAVSIIKSLDDLAAKKRAKDANPA